MTSTLRIRPEAEAELSAAVDWYESKRVGLGAELMAEVDEALENTLLRPAASPLWRKGHPYRRRTLDRFPYSIFFKASPGLVEVVAIAHAKRRPGYWVGR